MNSHVTISIRIVAFLIIAVMACTGRRQQENDIEQLLTIHELIVLRTEGLLLTEIIDSTTSNKKIITLIAHTREYYRETHPDFLHLCTGQPIVFGHGDFNTIQKLLQNQIDSSKACLEAMFVTLSIANTNKSIEVYERILQKHQQTALCRFALRALPGLYTQQKELYVWNDKDVLTTTQIR